MSEPVADQVAAGAFDDAGGDGPARSQGLVVAQVLVLAGQVADAGVSAGPLGAGEAGGVRLGGDLGSCPGAVPCQYRERFDRYPVLGCRLPGGMQGPGGLPDVFEHVDQVDHDVDGDAAPLGFGADQVQLVPGAVDKDHPGPMVLRVVALSLVECGCDHVGGVVFHRPGQPFRGRPGPGPQPAVAVPAAGRGDDVVRAPGAGSRRRRRSRWPSVCGWVSRRRPAGSASGPGGRRLRRYPWRRSRPPARPAACRSPGRSGG